MRVPICFKLYQEEENHHDAQDENNSELVKQIEKQRKRAIAAARGKGKSCASRNSYKDKGGKTSHNAKVQKQLSIWWVTIGFNDWACIDYGFWICNFIKVSLKVFFWFSLHLEILHKGFL